MPIDKSGFVFFIDRIKSLEEAVSLKKTEGKNYNDTLEYLSGICTGFDDYKDFLPTNYIIWVLDRSFSKMVYRYIKVELGFGVDDKELLVDNLFLGRFRGIVGIYREIVSTYKELKSDFDVSIVFKELEKSHFK